MKTVLRRKGDLQSTPPVAVLHANPTVIALAIGSVMFDSLPKLECMEILVPYLRQLERGDIDFFTTKYYLVSTTEAFTVAHSFTTPLEIEA